MHSFPALSDIDACILLTACFVTALFKAVDAINYKVSFNIPNTRLMPSADCFKEVR